MIMTFNLWPIIAFVMCPIYRGRVKYIDLVFGLNMFIVKV